MVESPFLGEAYNLEGDLRAGLKLAVHNSQQLLAMAYVVNLIDELDSRVTVLEAENGKLAAELKKASLTDTEREADAQAAKARSSAKKPVAKKETKENVGSTSKASE